MSKGDGRCCSQLLAVCCTQLLILPDSENVALQEMVLLTHIGAFSLSCSVRNGKVACAHCLISVLVRYHTTVVSENHLFPLQVIFCTRPFLAGTS